MCVLSETFVGKGPRVKELAPSYCNQRLDDVAFNGLTVEIPDTLGRSALSFLKRLSHPCLGYKGIFWLFVSSVEAFAVYEVALVGGATSEPLTSFCAGARILSLQFCQVFCRTVCNSLASKTRMPPMSSMHLLRSTATTLPKTLSVA